MPGYKYAATVLCSAFLQLCQFNAAILVLSISTHKQFIVTQGINVASNAVKTCKLFHPSSSAQLHESLGTTCWQSEGLST